MEQQNYLDYEQLKINFEELEPDCIGDEAAELSKEIINLLDDLISLESKGDEKIERVQILTEQFFELIEDEAE